MKIIYIKPIDAIEKPKRLSKKQRIHALAIESLADRRVHDQEKAKKMFAHKWEELRALEAKIEKM